jgi:tetratricopeptide (TPR) repeat protein
LGTVEAGKIADLVLLEANPLVDIGNTRKIAAVVVNGKYFSRSSLDEMLAKIETVANLASISEPKEAIEIFKFNVELHPRSFNAYDSLAEAYLNNGDQGPAIENFEKSLELNRFNWNAAEKLKKLKKK